MFSVLSLLTNYSTTQKHAGSILETCVLLHHMEKQQKLHMLIFSEKITSFFAVCRIDIEHKAMSGGNSVKGQPEERAIQLAQYLVETGAANRCEIRREQVHRAQRYYGEIISSQSAAVYAGA